MNNITYWTLAALLVVLVATAIYLDMQSVDDCEAVGGEYVWDHCIDRDVIIEDY